MIGMVKKLVLQNHLQVRHLPTLSHTSILCKLTKLFICEKAYGEITQTISAQRFPICENNIPHKRLSTPKRHHKTFMHLKSLTGKIYPNHALLRSSHHTLYYPCITPANISYARATLSLSENLHLQKEVLLIHNNSFYIRKLFFSVIGRVRKRNIIVRCRHTNSQTSILNERHLLLVFFSSAIFKCRQLLFICEKHYAGIPNN